RPPALDPIADKEVDENQTLEFTIQAADLDGDRLTYSASNLPEGASFDEATQTFTWTPTYEQAGVYEDVHFEVTDGEDKDSEDITITVNDVNQPPIADIQAIPVQGKAPLTVFFDGRKSKDKDLDGIITAYSWDFGDGDTDSGETTTHEYMSAAIYTATLTVIDDKGASGFASVEINVESNSPTYPPFQQGWPRINEFSDAGFTSPVIADIDGDGNSEVAAGFRKNEQNNAGVCVWNYDGSIKTGWPVQLSIGADISTPPAVGDIDGNGKCEILIAASDGIYGWDYTGIRLFDVLPVSSPPRIFNGAPIIIDDLDGDGKMEIIAARNNVPEILSLGGTLYSDVYVWSSNGTVQSGWPQQIAANSIDSLAVGDLDGDGQKEIVAGTDNLVYVFNTDGTLKWSKHLSGASADNYVVLGDVDNDSYLDVVVASLVLLDRVETVPNSSVTTLSIEKIFILDKDGILVNSWSIPQEGFFKDEFSLADLDKDGDLEIVDLSYDDSNKSQKIYAWHHDGSNVSGWPIVTEEMIYSPAVADVYGDTDIDMVSGIYNNSLDVNSNIYIWDSDGSTSLTIPISDYVDIASFDTVLGLDTQPTIVDLDKDGDLELIQSIGNYICVLDLESDLVEKSMEWTTYHHDSQHTNLYSPYSPPVVNLQAEPTSGEMPLEVNFTWDITDTDGTISRSKMIFEDGEEIAIDSNSGPVSHLYGNPGTYYPRLIAWDDDNINGFSQVSISVTSIEQKPDLKFTSISLDLANPHIGQAILITAPWKNIGQATAPAGYSINCKVTKQDGSIFSDETFVGREALGAGETKTFQHTVSKAFTEAGAYTVTLIVDSGQGSVNESNENNNSIEKNLTVTAPAYPPRIQVTRTSLDFTLEPGNHDSNDVTIKNIGGGTLRWSAPNPGESWLSLSQGTAGGSLGAGEHADITIKVDSSNLSPGIYRDIIIISSNAVQHQSIGINVTLKVTAPSTRMKLRR
ncbi:MAG: VCBS repeat-containing protein, partial [Candidatus Omnitrophica bacterium]|nr:VCBS repeat-containing protein [Candidatus Omnitrophota bacterium]